MRKMSKATQAVFFDFGGTLYSYANPGLGLGRILRELAARLEIELTADDLRAAYHKAAAETARDFTPRPYYLHRDFFMDHYRRFAEAFGAQPSEELLGWCHEEQCRRVIENFELRDDCLSTLRSLRAAGLHIAIVSNIDNDYLEPMVARASLDTVLDAWTSSETAGSCKPDPGIFHLAMEKASCDPGQAVFVGDSLSADIAGAGSLGMRTVLIEEPDAPDSDEGPAPDHRIRALSEVLAIALPS